MTTIWDSEEREHDAVSNSRSRPPTPLRALPSRASFIKFLSHEEKARLAYFYSHSIFL